MADQSIIKTLWTRGALPLLPALMLTSLGFGIVYPLVPSLATDFFASQSAGHPVHCEQVQSTPCAQATPPIPPSPSPPPPDSLPHSNSLPNAHYHSHSLPHAHSHPHSLPHVHLLPRLHYAHNDSKACHNAHSTAVYWSSTTSFFSNTVVAFLVAPILGDLSDRYGRKPLFALGIFLSCLPLGAIFLYLYNVLPFYWYYVANAVANTNATLSASLAYMADVLEGRQRATGFGLIVAVMFVGFSIGPLLGVMMSKKMVCWVGFGVMCAALLYVAVFVNESLQPNSKARSRQQPLSFRTLGTFKMFTFLGRSSLFIKLAVCLCILGVAQEGVQDMLLQYLQLKVDFKLVDQGVLFSVLGGANLFVQTLVVSYGVAWYGEQRMLVLGLGVFIVYQVMLGLITSKTMAYVAVGLGSLSGVTFPAISSIKANNCSDDEQGMLQGALSGLRAIAQGLGPLLFALLFSLFTRTDSRLPYIPGMPFFFSCVITMGALVVACTIHPDAGLGSKEASATGSSKDLARAPYRAGSHAVEQDEEEERAALLGSAGGDEQQGLAQVDCVDTRKMGAAFMAAAEQIPSLEHP